MFRPEVDDEIQEQIEALTSDKFAVPESKVSFNDRLRILIQLYKNKQGRQQSVK
jgi:hypothetical protein